MLSALKNHPWRTLLSLGLAGAIGVAIWLYSFAGLYGFNVVLRRGGSIWLSITPDDARLSPSMRMGLRAVPPVPQSSEPVWSQLSEGFESGEMAVLAEGVEVDRFLLARIDPKRHRFLVRNAPAGNKELGDWVSELGALLVVNGSYFAQDGWPDTPFKSNGVLLGPTDYKASHGAFVSSLASTHIVDLKGSVWQDILRNSTDAMVSYPILLAEDGTHRVKADSRWLANRTFIGEDREGRIIIGTSAQAFFSIERLALFLKTAPLNLKLALNLDGGPLACQAIAYKDFKRDFCGDWETAVHDGQLKLLRPMIGHRRWALPIVLAVVPR